MFRRISRFAGFFVLSHRDETGRLRGRIRRIIALLRRIVRLSGFFVLPYRDETGRRRWRVQRLTAMVLLPLYVWLLLVAFPEASVAQHKEFLLWMQNPINAVLTCLTIIFSLHHMVLGLDTIVEDYVASPRISAFLLFCIRWKTFMFMLGVLAATFNIFLRS